MSQPLKLLGGAAALITAALLGGTLIGSVLAATPGDSGSSAPVVAFGDEETDAAAYCQTFLDTFASELGVETDELAPAAKAAAIAAVNAAGLANAASSAASIFALSTPAGQGALSAASPMGHGRAAASGSVVRTVTGVK
jgi:hypothetical protein